MAYKIERREYTTQTISEELSLEEKFQQKLEEEFRGEEK